MYRRYITFALSLLCILTPRAQTPVLWGCNAGGGAYGYGNVFKVNADGSNYMVLYSATGGDSAKYTGGSLLRATDGKFYGIATQGGAFGFGTIYSYDPYTAIYATLHSFDSVDGNAGYNDTWQQNKLLQARNGIIYGTTALGGVGATHGHTASPTGAGVLFSYNISTATYTKLHDFDTLSGVIPYGSLMQAADGKLYSMCYGQSDSASCIYSFDPATNIYTDIHNFSKAYIDSNHYYMGEFRDGFFYQDSLGLLYATAQGYDADGCIFTYDITTGSVNIIHRFDSLGLVNDGWVPTAGLVKGPDGKYYGMTQYGGPSGAGIIYSFDLNSHAYDTVFFFNGQNGKAPYGALLLASDGKFYGTTTSGGANNHGTVFRFHPVSHQHAIIYNMDSTGVDPQSTLLEFDNCLASANYTDSVCGNAAYTFHNRVFPGPGHYVDTVQAAVGCDTIYSLTVVSRQVFNYAQQAVICGGSSYNFNGRALTGTGNYIDTLFGAGGCDSIIHLALTVNPLSFDTLYTVICQGDSFLFFGNYLHNTGTYNDTLVSTTGCDSIVSLKLTVTPIPHYTYYDSICAGNQYFFHDTVVHATGTYTTHFFTGAGCDSIVTVHLFVKPVTYGNASGLICLGTPFVYYGRQFNSAGLWIDTITNMYGCDSIVTLNLGAILPDFDSAFAGICSGDSFLFGHNWLHNTGVYFDTLHNVYGCDSIEKLYLTAGQRPQIILNDTVLSACLNQTVTFIAQSQPWQYVQWTDSFNTYSYSDTFAMVDSAAGVYLFTISDSTYACSITQPIYVNVNVPPAQSLCLVTTDTALEQNIIIWDKADKFATDSFYLYRANTPDTVFSLLAAVSRDSLSEYWDGSSLPDSMSYRYKINVRDTCGSYGALSNYHQTIYLQYLGAGSFQWTPYVIENITSPVNSYDIYRDATGTGAWQLLSSVVSNQTTYTDAQYAQYPQARYKAVVTLAAPCNPTRSVYIITSNIVIPYKVSGIVGTGLQKIGLLNNPVSNEAVLININQPVTLSITNGLGQIISNNISAGTGNFALPMSQYAPGIYFITIMCGGSSQVLKVVKY